MRADWAGLGGFVTMPDTQELRSVAARVMWFCPPEKALAQTNPIFSWLT